MIFFFSKFFSYNSKLSITDFIPNSDALENWDIYIHEIVGFIFYKILSDQ